ncbi:CAP domain-containing protein [Flavobacterium caseinilyticum]|uniref:CAP domain-containing protein n=1 Tax=Flavobacterium caseinilyticum TaxID=2541732 RepID=A0A4R5AXF8_9FLAO|nr:CAP domain-containing protein [Flavobacterium caseinilyticum]TDD76870.1 CAP domain-containing protein [Flavobacterium caseinilyticum]
MKQNLLSALLLVPFLWTMNSCSSDASETQPVNTTVQKSVTYSYNTIELETMNLINAHRISVGLNPLEKINYMSVKSEEHNDYMIANNVVNHNDFVARSEDIIKTLGAKTVSENIAFNFNTPQSVLTAWLASPGHKENIEGNFTHFGIAIKENPVTGKKYYTNIFAKI